jgi:hypothetical protein
MLHLLPILQTFKIFCPTGDLDEKKHIFSTPPSPIERSALSTVLARISPEQLNPLRVFVCIDEEAKVWLEAKANIPKINTFVMERFFFHITVS